MWKKIFLLIILLLAADSVFGATIHGTVYDLNLDIVEDTRVEINTIPKQHYVAKDGVYSFSVPVGDYIIKASYYRIDELMSFVEEEISVKEDGNYILDLILFPSFEEEDVLLNESEIDVVVPEGKRVAWPYVLAGILLAALAVFYWIKKKKIVKKDAEKSEGKKEVEKEELANDLDDIIKIIKEQGGRTTQKDIRKKIPLSEAKISLMIAELEEKGVVRKIKKGRGNIIILN
ncbi:MAG: winged helix-turn-helix transcriptional regulator [Nanoarchaeota archaeon]|nr:winged helix-turn-helix transcriptional regulator [Nanoarchaeota archaeon]